MTVSARPHRDWSMPEFVSVVVCFVVIAFRGDGSFMMSLQILIDDAEHNVRGTIVEFDYRRMAAIRAGFKTSDPVAVGHISLASAVSGVFAIRGEGSVDTLKKALEAALDHPGLSDVHVPVYCGPDERGCLGAWGQRNVGNWGDDVQSAWISQDIEAAAAALFVQYFRPLSAAARSPSAWFAFDQ